MDLANKLENLPESTGVYMMKDSRSKVIYVGKAKNLRSRIKTYFQKGGDGRPLIGHLVRKVADVNIVLTDTEKEALILENNLIKQFKPRYNVLLRDDKTYVSIRLDMRKKFYCARCSKHTYSNKNTYKIWDNLNPYIKTFFCSVYKRVIKRDFFV